MRRVWWMLLLLAFQPCEGLYPELEDRLKEPPPPEIQKQFGGWNGFLQKLEHMFPLAMVVTELPGFYYLEEGRFPSSWKEVCALDWVPVRCDLLVNPFTGRKLVDEKKGGLGSIWLERKGEKTDVVIYFYESVENLREPKELPLDVRPPDYTILGQHIRDLWKELDDTLKGAMVLATILESAFQLPKSCLEGLGWEDFVKRFPGLKALRNPYTGEPLEPIAWEWDYRGWDYKELARGGRPGDVVVVWHTHEQSMEADVRILVEDGRFLSEVLEELAEQRRQSS